MKTIQKAILLLFLPLLVQIFFVSCNCPEPLISYYSNKSFFLNHLNNSGSTPVLNTTDFIPKQAYGLRLQLSREKTAFYKPSESFLFQSAYAFTRHCPPPQIIARDSITNIQIFTLRDFNSAHPEGAEVTNLFSVYQRFSFTPVEEFLRKYKTVLYKDDQLEETVDFLLMTPPDTGIIHQFKLTITLSDGRLIELLTTPIRLV